MVVSPPRCNAPCNLRPLSRIGMLLVASFIHGLAASDDIEVIETIELATFRGGEATSTEVELGASQLLVVEVDQSAAEVAVTISDSRGRLLVTTDPPSGRSGSVVGGLEAPDSGWYGVKVTSRERSSYSGRVVASVAILGAGASSRRQAVLTMTEAGRLNHVADTSASAKEIQAARRAARDLYKSAADEWARLDESRYEGLSLYYAATLAYDLYDWDEAVGLSDGAVSVLSNTNDGILHADAQHRLAAALIEQRNPQSLARAFRVLRSALGEYRQTRDVYRIGVAQNAFGMVAFYRDEWLEAKDWFRRAAVSFARTNEDVLAVRAFTNSAKSDENLGRLVDASRTHAVALELANKAQNPLDRASVLDNYADTLALQGRVQDALALYQESADEFDRLGDPVGQAKAINGIGFVMYRLGEWESARNHAQRALNLQQGSFERRPLFETLQYLGNAHRGLGETNEAISAHRQAYEIASTGIEKTLAQLELGNDLLAAERYSEAGRNFEEARDVAESLHALMIRGYATSGIGKSRLPAEPQHALDLFATALAQHSAAGNLSGEAEALQLMAHAHHTLGNSGPALEFAERATRAIEALRGRVDNPRLVASFNGLSRPNYELQIELLMHLAETSRSPDAARYIDASLEVSERGRAQSLLEYLGEGLLGDAIGDESPAAARYRLLKEELIQLRYQRERLAVGGKSNRSSLEALETDLDRTITRLTILEGEIRKLRSPDQSITAVRNLTAHDLRALIEKSDDESPTMVLEYALGPNASFMWVITKARIVTHRLPSEARLNALARVVHEEFSTAPVSRRNTPGGDPARRQLAALLLGPVADQLDAHRLVIVPDGALYFVPFAALPVPDSKGGYEPLGARTEVTYLPSLTTLHQQRREKGSQARSLVAIFADPVFSLSDRRFPPNLRASSRAAGRLGQGDEQPLLSAAAPRELVPLPWSGAEAQVIEEVAAGHGEVFMATDFDASVSTVLDRPLAAYRILHFATHGWADSSHPELSSLTFTKFDRHGQPQPSELQLPDIYGLDLDSDLVVLSACDTALGKYIPGEGVLGLTHAFMSAGSRRVLSTLWQVNDQATARLMELFYRALLVDGHPPGRALAIAQRSLMAERRWADPYFWAGVSLQGDWKWGDR